MTRKRRDRVQLREQPFIPPDHTCTRRCLRTVQMFGRTFSWCARYDFDHPPPQPARTPARRATLPATRRSATGSKVGPTRRPRRRARR